MSVFGSVARGEETPTSDIDFLVEFEPGSSLFDLLHIKEELETLLGVPVDVVSVGGLKDRDDHIRREAVDLDQAWEIATGAVPDLVERLGAR